MNGFEFTIRPLKKEDSRRVWEIRNHPVARANSTNSEEIPFEKHEAWFAKKYFASADNHCFILEVENSVIGYCRLDYDSEKDHYVSSIALDRIYHGKGLGHALLRESLTRFSTPKAIFAEVKKSNIASMWLFKKNGFVTVGEDGRQYQLSRVPRVPPRTFTGKRILIFQQRNWARSIGHFLAKRLAAEGCYLAAVTFKKSVHKDVLKQNDVKYELLLSDDEVMDNPKKYLGQDRYELKEICQELGIDSVWPFIHSVRNFVKSYGAKYFYGFGKNVSDEFMLDYLQAVYKYMKSIFREFRPDVILTPNFVALPFIMFNLYARRQGVKMFAVTDSKVQGVIIFSHDYLDSSGPFHERVDELNQGLAETKNRLRAQQYIREFREKLKVQEYAVPPKTNHTLWGKIRHELSPYYHIVRWYLGKNRENYVPALGPTVDWRPPRIILRDHYANKRNCRFMNNFAYYPFEKLARFVYFPLQYQPEATIDCLAPYFSNQIETARLVAMSLPADYTLVVKEHPAMIGLRSPSYLKKISALPNVKLVDYRLSNEEILKKCDLVISPSSTTIAEASFYRKPVIQLGDLGTTLKLPNVFRHTDLATLPGKMLEVLKADLTTAEYERRLENFVAAAYDAGYEYKYFQVWSRGRGDDLNRLWEIYKSELQRILSQPKYVST